MKRFAVTCGGTTSSFQYSALAASQGCELSYTQVALGGLRAWIAQRALRSTVNMPQKLSSCFQGSSKASKTKIVRGPVVVRSAASQARTRS